MINQFFIARSGMSTYQKILMNITNNIANAQTVGFKQSRVEVENLFPMILAEAEASLSNEDEVEPALRIRRGMDIGTGVRIVAVLRDFKQGSIEVTNRPLDMAIEGEGFFQFRMQDGRVAYSRAGNLRNDSYGNITDQNGHLLDPPIQIPQQVTTINIDQEGRVMVQIDNEIQQREVGQILLARFPNQQGLKPIGQNLFLGTPESGEAIVEIPSQNAMGSIAQFSVENSNVDIIDQMTKMLITQKGFDLLAKAAASGDAMLKSAASATSS